jgi:hypothetical protein
MENDHSGLRLHVRGRDTGDCDHSLAGVQFSVATFSRKQISRGHRTRTRTGTAGTACSASPRPKHLYMPSEPGHAPGFQLFDFSASRRHRPSGTYESESSPPWNFAVDRVPEYEPAYKSSRLQATTPGPALRACLTTSASNPPAATYSRIASGSRASRAQAWPDSLSRLNMSTCLS